MSQPIIQVENLGKKYFLAQQQENRPRYQSLRESLVKGMCAVARRLRRPFARTTREDPKEFWALRDVSFEVQSGEVVGIIGKNGAGKSTLLKILSRITEPTTGQVTLRGRVASLLEVGTGFHPELTGRENIFLNGTILGMSRAEIRKKFDEIVAFAEIERFLDTPVKRYSSGMYMRLAFAVAAHLEPEILVIDEVLAVGDADFQKKCLRKMGEVARGGRTVLFVSHNMQAVAQLTTTVVQLENGRICFQGPTAEGVARYRVNLFDQELPRAEYWVPPKSGSVHLTRARVVTSEAGGEHICGRPIQFEFDVHVGEPRGKLCFSFQIVDESGRPLCHFWLFDRGPEFRQGSGVYQLRCAIPRLRVYQGRYTLNTYLSDRRGIDQLESLMEICPFQVTMRGIEREEYEWQPGTMVYWEDCEWERVSKWDSKVHSG